MDFLKLQTYYLQNKPNCNLEHFETAKISKFPLYSRINRLYHTIPYFQRCYGKLNDELILLEKFENTSSVSISADDQIRVLKYIVKKKVDVSLKYDIKMVKVDRQVIEFKLEDQSVFIDNYGLKPILTNIEEGVVNEDYLFLHRKLRKYGGSSTFLSQNSKECFKILSSLYDTNPTSIQTDFQTSIEPLSKEWSKLESFIGNINQHLTLLEKIVEFVKEYKSSYIITEQTYDISKKFHHQLFNYLDNIGEYCNPPNLCPEIILCTLCMFGDTLSYWVDKYNSIKIPTSNTQEKATYVIDTIKNTHFKI